MKPRILFIIDRPGWSFDIDARNLAQVLGNRYDFRFLYVEEGLPFEPKNYDLIHVFFWGERYHRQYRPSPSAVIKEISSHRWEAEEKYGYLSPTQMAETYLHDAATVVATSQKLFHCFEPHVEKLFHCPKGFNSQLFCYRRPRSGPLQVGWAGNARDVTKGLVDILRPACQGRVELQEAGGGIPHREMGGFYNQLDVILVGSIAEGTPQPLIEAMASGCFPICTDVGVAPEVIQPGVNGLIVDRSVADFQEALTWCAANLDQVRHEGRENARRMLESRGWSTVAQRWSRLFDTALDRSASGSIEGYGVAGPKGVPPATSEQESDALAPSQPRPAMAPPKFLPLASWGQPYAAAEVAGLAIQDAGAPVMVTGDTAEITAQTLSLAGYPVVRRMEPGRDSLGFLQESAEQFGAILLWDLPNSAKADHEALLSATWQALKPGGRVFVKMANRLNWRSLAAGVLQQEPFPTFTEYGLNQILLETGFCQIQLYGPESCSLPNRLYLLPLQIWHKLRGRIVPKTYGKYLLMSAKRPESEL